MRPSGNALPDRPYAYATVSASRRLEGLLAHEGRITGEDRNTLVRHLAAIERIEDKLGLAASTIEEFEHLIRQRPRLINEAYELHMTSTLKTAAGVSAK